jgi:aldose 1-epimerase
MTAIKTIYAGDSVCTLCPELGGSILSWQVGGQNILRHTSDAAFAGGSRLDFASFPLVPYSNRIGQATFEWNGRQIVLTKNFAPEPHAIHGTGWVDAWEAEMVGPDKIILRLSHKADNRWPWAFDAEQVITITSDGLRLELSAYNRSDEAAPLGFGHHPYFDQTGAHMEFKALRVWMSGDEGLPTDVATPGVQYGFGTMGAIEGRNIDHCYAGWSGQTRIEWAERKYALEIISPMRAAIVYIPKGGDAFCFEPVPHINNALNMPGEEPAMPVIAPGEAYRSVIEFRAVCI